MLPKGDAEDSHRAVLQPNGRRHTEMRTAAVWSLIPRGTASVRLGGGNWPGDGSGIGFRATRTRRPPQVPVIPPSSPATERPHGPAICTRKAPARMRAERPLPAWGLQSTVRLPAVMAPSRELPAGVSEDTRDTHCGPPTMCSMQAHRWPDRQLCATGLIGRWEGG